MLWYLLFGCIICSGFGGHVAAVKGRPVIEGMIFGLFLGPFGVVAIAGLPGRETMPHPVVHEEEDDRIDVDQWDFSRTMTGPHDARMPRVRT
jgi:hypothetical protein